MTPAVRPPKWPSTKNWPWSPTKHSDDSTHQSPERFLNVPVVITEKLDGGNTCLFRGDVYARSNVSPSHDGWMAMVRKHHAWKTVREDQNLIINGEDIYGIHSIEYDPVAENRTFYMFGVRSLLLPDVIFGWNEIEFYADLFEVPTVPVLFRGQFDRVEQITEWFDANLKNESAIGGSNREGFVIRIEGLIEDWSRDAAKYIRPRHVQTQDKHWRVNWQKAKIIVESNEIPQPSLNDHEER